MQLNILELGQEFAGLLSNFYIHIFVIVILFDIASGFVKSWKEGKTNSTIGLFGIAKHMLILMLVLVVYPYMRVLNLDWYATAFVWFYIGIYGVSITENLHVIGVPMPDWVISGLEKLTVLKPKKDE